MATKEIQWRSWGLYARIHYSQKIAASPHYFLTERILHHVWIKLFFQILVYMRTAYGEEYIVEITPEQAGEYGFSCGMNMMHGKMIVE